MPTSKQQCAQADFALNLLREISRDNNKNNGNLGSVIISPSSLAIALAMAYAGARGETAAEINKLLGNDIGQEEIHEFYGKTMSELFNNAQKKDSDLCLDLANKIYVKTNYPILDEFDRTLRQSYGANFEQINFEDNENAAEQMNKFVESATHGKIKQLVEPNTLNELTRLVLINAIYFRARWETEFDPSTTKIKKFFISNDKQIEIEMMRNMWSDRFDYAENDQIKILGKDYKGGSFDMFFLLPKERFGLANALANLDGTELLRLIETSREIRERKGVIYLYTIKMPKFKLEVATELNEVLKKLSIKKAFDQDAADFSGIAAATNEEPPLYISKVLQKTFIEVNEVGTEAAAATEIEFMCGCGMIPERLEFIADQPFAMFIVERAQKLILFAGIFAGE